MHNRFDYGSQGHALASEISPYFWSNVVVAVVRKEGAYLVKKVLNAGLKLLQVGCTRNVCKARPAILDLVYVLLQTNHIATAFILFKQKQIYSI